MSARWTLIGVAAAALTVDLAVWGGDTQLRTGHAVPTPVVVALAVATYATLIVGERYPLLTFSALWTFGLVGLALPSYEAFVGLLAALYAIARHAPRQVAVMGLLLCLIPVGINVANASAHQTEPSLAGSVIIAVLWLLLFSIVWCVGRLAQRTAVRSLDHARALDRAAAEAQRVERVRIARELHDSVAHTLSAVVLQAAGAKAVCPRGSAPTEVVVESLQAIERSGSQAISDLHRLLGLLRDGAATADGSDPAPIGHSLDELSDLVGTTRSSGLIVTVSERGTPMRLDPSVDHAAYRFAQETLTNAMRHAGAGGSVTLDVHWQATGLTLTAVSADGPNPPALPLHGGHGLAGLEERMRLLGGHLRWGSTAEGFVTEARLPTTGRMSVNQLQEQR